MIERKMTLENEISLIAILYYQEKVTFDDAVAQIQQKLNDNPTQKTLDFSKNLTDVSIDEFNVRDNVIDGKLVLSNFQYIKSQYPNLEISDRQFGHITEMKLKKKHIPFDMYTGFEISDEKFKQINEILVNNAIKLKIKPSFVNQYLALKAVRDQKETTQNIEDIEEKVNTMRIG